MKIELSNGLEVKAVMWLNIMVAEVQERAFLICLYVRMVDLSVLKLKLNTVSWHPLQRSHLDKILTSGGAVTVLRPSEFDGFKKFIEEVLNND